MRSAARVAGVLGTVGALLVGCTASRSAADPAVRKLHEHATVAGTVMGRAPFPLHALDAAAGVAGHVGGTTIDVLQASGVTRGGTGRVVLRIIVDVQVGDVTDHARGCFAYRFGGTSTGAPRQLRTCPPGRPLTLPTSAVPTVGPAQRATLVRALQGLSPTARTDPAAVRRAVVNAFGPDVFVRSGRDGAGVFVLLTSGDQCVSARTTATAVTAGPPAHGTDCRGG